MAKQFHEFPRTDSRSTPLDFDKFSKRVVVSIRVAANRRRRVLMELDGNLCKFQPSFTENFRLDAVNSIAVVLMGKTDRECENLPTFPSRSKLPAIDIAWHET